PGYLQIVDKYFLSTGCRYPRPTVLWISGQYLTVRDSSVDISAAKWGFMPRYPQHRVRFASNLQQEGPNRPIQTPTRRPQTSIGGHRVRPTKTAATGSDRQARWPQP